MKIRKIKIDKNIANKILLKAKIKEKVISIKDMKVDSLNKIYLLKTNKMIYTIRVFDREYKNYGISWKVSKEAYLLNRLKKSDVKVPKLFYKDSSKLILPFDYLILEYIEGKPLSELDLSDIFTHIS